MRFRAREYAEGHGLEIKRGGRWVAVSRNGRAVLMTRADRDEILQELKRLAAASRNWRKRDE